MFIYYVGSLLHINALLLRYSFFLHQLFMWQASSESSQETVGIHNKGKFSEERYTHSDGIVLMERTDIQITEDGRADKVIFF